MQVLAQAGARVRLCILLRVVIAWSFEAVAACRCCWLLETLTVQQRLPSGSTAQAAEARHDLSVLKHCSWRCSTDYQSCRWRSESWIWQTCAASSGVQRRLHPKSASMCVPGAAAAAALLTTAGADWADSTGLQGLILNAGTSSCADAQDII